MHSHGTLLSGVQNVSPPPAPPPPPPQSHGRAAPGSHIWPPTPPSFAGPPPTPPTPPPRPPVPALQSHSPYALPISLQTMVPSDEIQSQNMGMPGWQNV